MSIVLKERDYKNLAPITPTKWKRYVEVVNDSSIPVPVNQIKLKPEIDNIPILQNVELEINLPLNCEKIMIRPRRNSRMKMSLESGGTLTKYISSGLGGYFLEEFLNTITKIYISCDQDTMLEIIFYIKT